ncbi:hypothetical protein [Microtetraspora malaysiensis]|uniref:site-specific DNA-methyltransferase (cytosine-N(4)-specific) n=1 Tax=Microtetraspora malaysiensis TaxID=161358 RepID=A0ABW6SR40_9ACTN
MTALREPYWSDGQAAINNGDAREVLANLGDRSVDCIVTSPPYWGLRHYCDGQYSQEPTPEAYAANLRATFTEARRMLAARLFVGIELDEPFIRLAAARIREAGAASGGIP